MPIQLPTVILPKLFGAIEATKSADYTVLNTDAGTIFLAGGGANRTFTLPTLALGGGFWGLFVNPQANNMIITAPANKLIADGNATGTTATYSTASHIIGSAALVWLNDAQTFYHLVNLGGTTVTIS